MKVFAKFDEIPSMTLQDIKEKKPLRTHFRSDGQRENSIPSHKHSLRGYNLVFHFAREIQKKSVFVLLFLVSVTKQTLGNDFCYNV